VVIQRGRTTEGESDEPTENPGDRRDRLGGFLIAFGVAVIVLALNGRSTVDSSLKQEQIVGTPDMTPAAIKQEAQQAGLKDVSLPSCSVAGKRVDSGDRARCFARYMRIHALEATGAQRHDRA